MGLMQALSHVGYPLASDSGRLKVMHSLVLNHMSTGVIATYSIFYMDSIIPVISFTPASVMSSCDVVLTGTDRCRDIHTSVSMINVLDPGLRLFARVCFLQHKLRPFFKSGNNESAAACCRLSTDKCQHCVADSSASFHAKGEENLKPVCPHGSASQCFPTHKLRKPFNSFIKERQNSVSSSLQK